jgi:methylmalonyl-CoA mutase
MPASTLPPLADAFPSATEADWVTLAGKALRGAPLATLAGASEDGIPLAPLYPLRAPGRAIGGRAAGTAWRTVQRIDHPDAAVARRLAREASEGGAGELALVYATSPAAWGAGLPPAAGPQSLLAGLAAPPRLRIDAGEATAGFAAAGPAVLAFDPLATLAAAGSLAVPLEEHAVRAAGLVRGGFAGSIFSADGRPYHAAGATPVGELAAVLAGLVALLRALDGAGLPPEAAIDRIEATLVTDADVIAGIAKLRAWRLLHARLVAALGLAPRPARLHVETAWRMATRRDPDGDILRHGLAGFAAALGGADGIALLPHIAARGPGDAAAAAGAARIARNALLLLAEESHLGRVADPAAGAGAVEAMTEALAARAWARMQEIEAAGGLLAALRSGSLQAGIAAAAARRRDEVAAGGIVLVGSTRFALAEEPAAAPPPPAPPPPPAARAAGEVAPLAPAPLEPR